MSTPVLRRAAEGDLDRLIEVKDGATAGWALSRAEPGSLRHRIQQLALAHLLATGEMVVALEDDRVVGFGASILRDRVWFLSQLFVDPAVQNQGSGAAILDRLRSTASEARARCVLSSGDPRAFGLYLSRGMMPAWTQIEMLRRRPGITGDPPAGVETLQSGDQRAVDDLDAAQRGFTRGLDHRFIRAHAAGYAVRGTGGRLLAYLYVRSDGRVGPLAAADGASLRVAIDAGDALAGPEASWSVPSTSGSILERLLNLGYRPRMLSTFCTDAPLGPFDRMAVSGGLLL